MGLHPARVCWVQHHPHHTRADGPLAVPGAALQCGEQVVKVGGRNAGVGGSQVGRQTLTRETRLAGASSWEGMVDARKGGSEAHH